MYYKLKSIHLHHLYCYHHIINYKVHHLHILMNIHQIVGNNYYYKMYKQLQNHIIYKLIENKRYKHSSEKYNNLDHIYIKFHLNEIQVFNHNLYNHTYYNLNILALNHKLYMSNFLHIFQSNINKSLNLKQMKHFNHIFNNLINLYN